MTTGIIGKSGKFYKCTTGTHILTIQNNISDVPFVTVYFNDPIAPIVMAEIKPTLKQVETIKDLCQQNGLQFDDVAVHPIFDEFKKRRN